MGVINGSVMKAERSSLSSKGCFLDRRWYGQRSLYAYLTTIWVQEKEQEVYVIYFLVLLLSYKKEYRSLSKLVKKPFRDDAL